MKTKLYIIAILSIVTIVANAQTFQTAAVDNNTIQSHQIIQTGSNYNGQVYEPFSSATPSEQSAVGASSSPAKVGGPRRGYDANGNWTPDGDDFGFGAETGASDQYPIGDAVLPLLLMAMVFCGVIYLSRRKQNY